MTSDKGEGKVIINPDTYHKNNKQIKPMKKKKQKQNSQGRWK